MTYPVNLGIALASLEIIFVGAAFAAPLLFKVNNIAFNT